MKEEYVEYDLSGNRKLRIVQDECSESPREWDNLGTMICFHRNYNLGDKHNYKEPQDFYDDVKKEDIAIILPLYLYDHSGITMSIGRGYPFNDRWDSMQVGYIYITKEKVKKEYSVEKISKKLLEKVTRCLEWEVKNYDLYIRGEIYGFQIVSFHVCDSCKHKGEETEDSCWNFYGCDLRENGILDHLSDEDRKLVEAQL